METNTATIAETETRVISVPKSKLALYKGLGKDVEFIANEFKITPQEVRKLMQDAGLAKSKRPEYIVQLVNDIA